MERYNTYDVKEIEQHLNEWAAPYLKIVEQYPDLPQITVVLDQMAAEAAYGVSESSAKGREVFNFEKEDHILSIHKSLLNRTLEDRVSENINLILPKFYKPHEHQESILKYLEDKVGYRLGRGVAGICLFCNRPGYKWIVHAHSYPYRFHVPLHSEKSNYFFWENEETCEFFHMKPAHGYLVRTDIPHSTFNASQELRVNLVLDVI